MGNLLEDSARCVAEHYENNVIDYELIRLEKESPVEFALTLRTLDKWIKDHSIVLDVGVGVGHYAVHLAQRGCGMHLVDVCDSFLKITREKLLNENLGSYILSSHQASATHLYSQQDESVDYVLMLGPFYHIVDIQQRNQAVKEAQRVLKKDGLLFAAGINRLAILHEVFHAARFFGDTKIDVEKLESQLKMYCETGVSDKSLFPPLGDGYCCTIDEFQSLFSPLFSQLDFVGLESFSAFKQTKCFDYSAVELSLWLSILEKTSRTMEGIASSEHFLYVGKKR